MSGGGDEDREGNPDWGGRRSSETPSGSGTGIVGAILLFGLAALLISKCANGQSTTPLQEKQYHRGQSTPEADIYSPPRDTPYTRPNEMYFLPQR